MNKLTINSIGVAILAVLLALNALSLIELGALIWLVAIFAIVGSFNVISARYEEERSDG